MLEGMELSSLVRMGVILVIISFVISMLPESPFSMYINNLSDTEWLKYFNWFFPVTECIATLETWLTAITAFYAVSALARISSVID